MRYLKGEEHPRFKHGHCSSLTKPATPTWNSWSAMMTRCTKEYSPNYDWYGGRGIKVCEKWHTFLGFLEDMGERPAGRTLDRIDFNGDYNKNNCRWATAEVQANNKRNTHWITFAGETLSLAQTARKFNINQSTLRNRLKTGRSIEDALLSPVLKR